MAGRLQRNVCAERADVGAGPMTERRGLHTDGRLPAGTHLGPPPLSFCPSFFLSSPLPSSRRRPPGFFLFNPARFVTTQEALQRAGGEETLGWVTRSKRCRFNGFGCGCAGLGGLGCRRPARGGGLWIWIWEAGGIAQCVHVTVSRPKQQAPVLSSFLKRPHASVNGTWPPPHP